MERPLVLLCLVAQLLFALLPGDGLVLCLGASGHDEGAPDHGVAASLDSESEHHRDCVEEHSPVHREERGGECDGHHLTRGEAEAWSARPAPPTHPATPVLVPSDFSSAVTRGLCSGSSAGLRLARWSPPPRLATAFVGTTVLRI